MMWRNHKKALIWSLLCHIHCSAPIPISPPKICCVCPLNLVSPVWVYDAQIIRRQIAALKQFDVVRFAQKACSNIHILRLMREQGVKVDSVSLGEIERALAAGYNPQTHPDDIVFTADVIDQATLERVSELQIPVNAGSVDMLDQLGGFARASGMAAR